MKNKQKSGVMSKRYGNNKENIWSASELQNEESASSNTSQSATNADKEADSNGTVSDVSVCKNKTIPKLQPLCLKKDNFTIFVTLKFERLC